MRSVVVIVSVLCALGLIANAQAQTSAFRTLSACPATVDDVAWMTWTTEMDWFQITAEPRFQYRGTAATGLFQLPPRSIAVTRPHEVHLPGDFVDADIRIVIFCAAEPEGDNGSNVREPAICPITPHDAVAVIGGRLANWTTDPDGSLVYEGSALAFRVPARGLVWTEKSGPWVPGDTVSRIRFNLGCYPNDAPIT